MLHRNVNREDLAAESASCGSNDADDYTGTTPSVIKILCETHDIDSWAGALTVAIAAILRDVENHERIKDLSGHKRTYFVEEIC